MNVYGSKCCYWVPILPPLVRLTKKEKDSIEKNLTVEEQNAVPEGAVCEFFDLMTMGCDYWLKQNNSCSTAGRRL